MKVTSDIKWKHLLISVAIPLVVGGLSGIINMNGFKSYAEMKQPPLAPPSWLFPIVWTILYILMGISAYLVYEKNDNKSKQALSIYAIQLVMNFMWPVFFFTLNAYLFSFIWLIIMWAFIIVMTVMFYRIDKLSGVLQIPYILWTTFAAYLNLTVYLIN